MLTWLLLGTGLYLLTLYVPSLFLAPHIGLGKYLGSRDEEPVVNALHGRAQRAARNFRENYPVFMALGILTLVLPDVDAGQAALGAMLFVLARLAYLPFYLLPVLMLRSVFYIVGLIGLGLMALALI